MSVQSIQHTSGCEAKEALVSVASSLVQKRFLIGGDGSIAVRLAPYAVSVTALGADKSALTDDMLVSVDFDGLSDRACDSKALPPELPLLLCLFKENPDIKCVIHAYPTCAVILGMEGRGLPAADYTPSVRELGSAELLPDGSVEQLRALTAIARTGHAALLKGNGCLVWGKDCAQALNMLEAMDFSFRVSELAGKNVSSVAAPARTRVTEVPKSEVVADVVRRTMPSCVGKGFPAPFERLVAVAAPECAVPDVPGAERMGIHALKSAEDVVFLKEFLRTPYVHDVAVLGGGMAGLETAEVLVGLGREVRVFAESGRLLTHTEHAAAVKRTLEEKGVRFHEGERVTAFLGRTFVEQLQTDRGCYPCDLCIVSACALGKEDV